VAWVRQMDNAQGAQSASVNRIRAIVRRWDWEKIRERLKGWKLKPMQERMVMRKAAAGDRTDRTGRATERGGGGTRRGRDSPDMKGKTTRRKSIMESGMPRLSGVGDSREKMQRRERRSPGRQQGPGNSVSSKETRTRDEDITGRDN